MLKGFLMKLKFLKSNDGSSYISASVIIIIFVICILLLINIIPVATTKLELDRLADDLVRVAEINGRVAEETDSYEKKYINDKNINIEWSKKGNIQLGDSIELTLTTSVEFGFGFLGKNNIILTSYVKGTSEVYHK